MRYISVVGICNSKNITLILCFRKESDSLGYFYCALMVIVNERSILEGVLLELSSPVTYPTFHSSRALKNGFSESCLKKMCKCSSTNKILACILNYYVFI